MITAAREHLASLLTGVGVPVHAYPPQALATPCIVIVPGFPYLTGHTLAGDLDVGLDVRVVVAQHNPKRLDELVYAALQALTIGGQPSTEVPAPSVDQDTGTLTCGIPVTLSWKE